MKLELIISIISLLLACISIGIHIYNFKSTLPNLKITYDKDSSYRLIPNNFGIRSYESNCSAIINLKISNLSSTPITIEIVYLDKNPNLKHLNNSGLDNCALFDLDGNMLRIENYKLLDLPLRIDSYDSIYCCAQFPYCPDKDEQLLTVKTPRKAYSLKVHLIEFHKLLSLQGNQLQ